MHCLSQSGYEHSLIPRRELITAQEVKRDKTVSTISDRKICFILIQKVNRQI